MAFASDMTSKAAAPSLIPEELPAVTVPVLLKAGRSLASYSAVVPNLGYSSVSNLMGVRFL